MPLYEHVYLARQDASAQQVEELTTQLKGVVEGLGGSIANTTDQTQTYTVKVDFLDASGKTITSQTTTVGPVAAGQSGRFTVTGAGPGIAAFRYAPLVDPSTIKPKG